MAETEGVDIMILYSKNNDKVHCVKCKSPKFNGKNNYFDHIIGEIENVKTKFWFSVKNNGSNFYFMFDNQWYRTSIVTDDGFDLHTWIYDKGEKLFKKNGE